jgi:hypothetical protein
MIIFAGNFDFSFINQFNASTVADFSVLLLIVSGIVCLGWARKRN